MTPAARQIWIAAFAAAYVAEVGRLKRGDVELCEDIAAGAATLASEALDALKDAQRNVNVRLSVMAARDVDRVLDEEEQP